MTVISSKEARLERRHYGRAVRVGRRWVGVALVVCPAVLAAGCGGEGEVETAASTTVPPALADAVAATRAAPVYAFAMRSAVEGSDAGPVVIAGRATGDGTAYQVFVGAGGASAAVGGAGTRLEIDAAGRCRVVDLTAVEPTEGGTPVGTADPEAVLQLLDAASDVDHEVVRGRDRWRGTVPAAAVAAAGATDDPTRVARMTGALGADDAVAFTAVAEPGAALSTVRLDVAGRQDHLTLHPVDGVPAEVSSPVGCFPGDEDYASWEAALTGLQLDCAQTQADFVEVLGDLPPEAADFAREQTSGFGSCAAVFDGP